MACGCSYESNPLSKGCSQGSRSKNIGRLIGEGYGAKQAAAIAYSVQRKAGCKVPKRRKGKAKKNPPYDVYGSTEWFVESWSDLPAAILQARGMADPGASDYDKMVVYDAGRMNRGPKGEFIAMFRPNSHCSYEENGWRRREASRTSKSRRRKTQKRAYARAHARAHGYKSNPGVSLAAVLLGAAIGLGAWSAWLFMSRYKLPTSVPRSSVPVPGGRPPGPMKV